VDDRQDIGRDRRPESRLDPAKGVQALADVQRRGLLAASELAERLVRSVDGEGQGAGRAAHDDTAAGRSAPRHDTPIAPSAAGPVDDLVRLWGEVVRLGLETFGQFLRPGVPGRPDSGSGIATLDVGTGTSTGVVRVVVSPMPLPDASTDRADAEVWLHNGSAEAYYEVALHCGDLRASDGAVLPAASVRFDPSVTDLPARSSRGVVVSVQAELPPGTYRGVVLAAGVPDAWLPIEVVKTADQPKG
jgi:hypothetical protein